MGGVAQTAYDGTAERHEDARTSTRQPIEMLPRNADELAGAQRPYGRRPWFAGDATHFAYEFAGAEPVEQPFVTRIGRRIRAEQSAQQHVKRIRGLPLLEKRAATRDRKPHGPFRDRSDIVAC